ncbi:MAG: tRNA (guanosine(37)-N1)-methyltransferase TrmD, partial [Parafannyhessea umbonata]|nr:tRNA (guanosine(37)-N1)-methyltransferase TrmD [Parafannyhessea umbonata]
HGAVDAWRRRSSIERTARWRPDLLDGATLTDEERAFAREATRREEGECDG